MVFPASGGAKFLADSAKVIRFARQGCTNRPFFHIVVMERHREQYDPVIEQVGSYDPMPNQLNEKLVSLNFERIKYWIGNGADVSTPVAELLGLAGFYPIHPRTYMTAWRNRRSAAENKEEVKLENSS
ncbi:probable 28S ribosomal protein S16, mitochondrial [Schistocerca piceifrons]|uniref:probable 28S ribosomal protein S16, mitochondrial n=1 Tax=Schistocerca piceifrons TaxID=274613 RepID=UPI001F5FC3EE|nr:probable 28S ribosomal protein S16, mitochondrial [Schistocerca piceifrons]XP_049812731.1 probable 28S ribosomal protein S16, mitochondrial [Schistocerca nitens]XP_049961208.1 probable 28S ribosomal protein S16, mitochondrial [Schistocerca serialis cubense]